MGDGIMKNVDRQSLAVSPGILCRMFVLIGFLIGCAEDTAMAGDEVVAAIPPECAGNLIPAGMRDDPASQVTGEVTRLRSGIAFKHCR